jgi:hypothetical protein
MADDAQLLELYGKLRAEILTRHFSFGRYFRANLICESGTTLGDVAPDVNCNSFGVTPATIEDPSSPPATITLGGSRTLLRLPEAVQLHERWRIGERSRDNPLMWSAPLFTCLAIEAHLGSPTARAIVWEGLKAIGSLYKFTEGHFKGYIIRWDPVTSDRWRTRIIGGRITPLRCCQFLTDASPRYLYCTPFDHPSTSPPWMDSRRRAIRSDRRTRARWTRGKRSWRATDSGSRRWTS